MASAKLTERFLRGLPDAPAVTDWWDSDLPGFGLRAYPSGRRAWIVRWRDATGRKRFKGGGAWPAVKAESAREWARRIVSRAALGLADDAAPSSGETVRTLWAQYEARAAAPHERDNRRSMGSRHILPALGAVAISELRAADIDRLVRALADKPRTGTAVKVHMHGAIELARALGYFPDDRRNPAALVRGYPYKPRLRRLGRDEVRSAWHTLNQAKKIRLFALCAAELLQCLILTGARCGELMGARWEWLDTDNPALVLHQHKTASRGVKRVELGPRAWRIIGELPRRNEYLFYGRAGIGRISKLDRPWGTILETSGIAHATVHDLRRTFASFAASDGMSISDIGVLLGHRELSATGIYAIADIRRRQELIAQAEAAIAQAFEPNN